MENMRFAPLSILDVSVVDTVLSINIPAMLKAATAVSFVLLLVVLRISLQISFGIHDYRRFLILGRHNRYS